jgi:hypothetical protein
VWLLAVRAAAGPTSPYYNHQAIDTQFAAGNKLHNEKLHDLYSSPSITRVTKSRRMT